MTDTETSDWPTPEMLKAGMDDLGWWVEPYEAVDSDMSAEDAAKINAMQMEVVESAFRAMLAAAPKPQGDDPEPVAYIVHDPMAGEPEVSFIKTIGLENEPLYPASALQSLKTERDEIDRLFKARDEQLTAEFSVSSSMAKLAGEASRRAEAAEAENATLKREIAGLREALAKVQAICLSEDDAEDTEYILGVASRALSQGGK